MADVLLPLEWDGSRLSIPNASRTQDGYLSTDAFVLFSGGAVVPVTSFNTRTGEVVLLEDDVLAALGYVPLNKHGDTMTGSLTLAGHPTISSSALQAATKGYVDSHAGSGSGLIDGQYLASSFGASGSKTKFTGAVNAGSTTLTLAAGSVNDFAVGQGILVTAGASGVDLLTKVDAVSGNTVTLHVAAGATRASTNVQHDDTVALQSGLDALQGGATLIMEPGFYRVNGPKGLYGALLHFPRPPEIPGNFRSECYRIIGYNVPVIPGADMPQESGAVIIQSDKVDTTASILASGDYSAGLSGINHSNVAIEGVTFRTYDNPSINGLDLGIQNNCFLSNVSFDTGMSAQGDLIFGGITPGGSQPTHATYAVRLPQVNACSQVLTRNLTVSNYGIGVIGDELWHTTGTWIQRCGVGVQGHAGLDANYPIVGDLLIVQCPKSIDASACRMRFDCHVDFETDHGAGAWWNPVNHFNDPSNRANGIIRYINISAGSGGGASIAIVIAGASGVTFHPTGF
jgi:hypothetical protein